MGTRQPIEYLEDGPEELLQFEAMFRAHRLMCHARDMGLFESAKELWLVFARRHIDWYKDRVYVYPEMTYKRVKQ